MERGKGYFILFSGFQVDCVISLICILFFNDSIHRLDGIGKRTWIFNFQEMIGWMEL